MPAKEAQWEKLLPSVIRAGYLFFDNVSGCIHSDALAAFLTAKEWTWRKLGTHEMEKARVDCQVVITGNSVSISADLARRAIFIELK